MRRAALGEPRGAGICGSASRLALPLALSAFQGGHEVSRLGPRFLPIAFSLLLLLPPATSSREASPETERDIAHYRARIGGRSTYPLHAQLGFAYLARARELDDDRDLDRALDCFRRSLGYQVNFEALLGSALALSRSHRFSEALTHARQAIDAAPTHPEALGVAFDVQLALGRLPEAATTLARMQALGTGFPGLTRLAAYRQATGDDTGAVTAMQEAVALMQTSAPGSTGVQAWAYARLGHLQRAACQSGAARKSCAQSLALLPDFHQALRLQADLEAAEGDLASAESTLTHLLRQVSHPEHRLALSTVLAARGDARRALRERNRALADLRSAVRHGSLHDLRPLAIALLDDPATAAEGLDAAQRDWDLRPEAISASILALALSRNDRHPEALSLSRQALATGIQDAQVLLRSALIHQRAGDLPEARRLLDIVRACPSRLDPADRPLAQEAARALGFEKS